MNKVYCPFCHQEVTEEATPDVASNAIGLTYVCYAKICRNKEKHYSNGNIMIPYKSEFKKASA